MRARQWTNKAIARWEREKRKDCTSKILILFKTFWIAPNYGIYGPEQLISIRREATHV